MAGRRKRGRKAKADERWRLARAGLTCGLDPVRVAVARRARRRGVETYSIDRVAGRPG